MTLGTITYSYLQSREGFSDSTYS